MTPESARSRSDTMTGCDSEEEKDDGENDEVNPVGGSFSFRRKGDETVFNVEG